MLNNSNRSGSSIKMLIVVLPVLIGSFLFGTEFERRAEGDIIFGVEYTLSDHVSNYFKSAALDESHFVTVFADWDDGRKGKAFVSTVYAEEIVAGSRSIFETDYAYYCQVAALDAEHFIVVYMDDLNGDYGTAVMGTVSGTEITFGQEFVFNTNTTRISP